MLRETSHWAWRLRNILILLTIFDPSNQTANPKAIPGSHIDFTITASNAAAGEVYDGTTVITDPIAATAELIVGDLGGAGSGPVEFTDGTGTASSGLIHTYIALANLTDDVDFSTDGIDYTFVPTPDADGFDSAVRYVRISPAGTFLGTTTATPTTFDLRIRIRVQ